MVAVFGFWNRRQDLDFFHQAFHSANVHSNFCSKTNKKEQNVLCNMGHYLVQWHLLLSIRSRGDFPMCRQTQTFRIYMHRHLRPFHCSIHHQRIIRYCDVDHSIGRDLELAIAGQTKARANARLCGWNSVSCKGLTSFWSMLTSTVPLLQALHVLHGSFTRPVSQTEQLCWQRLLF